MKGLNFFHFFKEGRSGRSSQTVVVSSSSLLLLVYFVIISISWKTVVSAYRPTVEVHNGPQAVFVGPAVGPSAASINGNKKCIDKNKESSEEFLMKLTLCHKNVSISCQIGGNSECHKDREAFKASAIISKHLTQCLIEANTTELKYIRFVIKAKYLRNLNELGSRGLPDFEPEIQRGQCTLGYTCIDHRYLKDVRVNCFAFHYDAEETPFNGTSKKFIWDAPRNYEGSVFFKSQVKVSYRSFYVDVDTAQIVLPQSSAHPTQF